MWALDEFSCNSRLWALEWPWHPAEAQESTCLAFIVSDILAFIRTVGQTDMARSTRLVIPFIFIYL